VAIPSILKASKATPLRRIIIRLAIVLLVRPAGLFGKIA